MGLNITCDCCQKPTTNSTEVGYVGKAYYCETCLPEYEDYKSKINEFHNYIAERAKQGLKEIKDIWLDKHPGATLPE